MGKAGQIVTQSLDGNLFDNLFQEIQLETSRAKLRRVAVDGHSFLILLVDFSNFVVVNSVSNVEILHVWWSRRFISVVHFSRFSFFVLRLRSLEASFKFQWASKKEDEEACQSVTKRAGKNDFSSLVWIWRMGKSLLLLCRSARPPYSHHVIGNDCFFD